MTDGPPAAPGEPSVAAPDGAGAGLGRAGGLPAAAGAGLDPPGGLPTAPGAAQRPAQAAGPGGLVPAAWQAAPRLRRLAAIGVAVVLAAVLTRHASLLLLGAPVLAALAAARRGARPQALAAAVTAAPSRCFEGEDVEIVATIAAVDEVTFRIEPGPAVTLADGQPSQVAIAGQPAQASWTVRPGAWGRHQLCTVTARCTDGMAKRA